MNELKNRIVLKKVSSLEILSFLLSLVATFVIAYLLQFLFSLLFSILRFNQYVIGLPIMGLILLVCCMFLLNLKSLKSFLNILLANYILFEDTKAVILYGFLSVSIYFVFVFGSLFSKRLLSINVMLLIIPSIVFAVASSQLTRKKLLSSNQFLTHLVNKEVSLQVGEINELSLKTTIYRIIEVAFVKLTGFLILFSMISYVTLNALTGRISLNDMVSILFLTTTVFISVFWSINVIEEIEKLIDKRALMRSSALRMTSYVDIRRVDIISDEETLKAIVGEIIDISQRTMLKIITLYYLKYLHSKPNYSGMLLNGVKIENFDDSVFLENTYLIIDDRISIYELNCLNKNIDNNSVSGIMFTNLFSIKHIIDTTITSGGEWDLANSSSLTQNDKICLKLFVALVERRNVIVYSKMYLQYFDVLLYKDYFKDHIIILI